MLRWRNPFEQYGSGGALLCSPPGNIRQFAPQRGAVFSPATIRGMILIQCKIGPICLMPGKVYSEKHPVVCPTFIIFDYPNLTPMANTFTQVYVQLVFAVKFRKTLIHESFREELEKYICGIIKSDNCKPIAIYCMPDHTHILVGLNPVTAISELARDIKSRSSQWVNERKFVQGLFRWQEGFGAFSYSKSSLDNVVQYILNQPKHHSSRSFKNEYIGLLDAFNIDYNPDYLFEWFDSTAEQY